MKISQLQHGETCTLLLRPESGASLPSIEKGQEVRLVFPRTGDEVLLSTGQSAQAVIAGDDVTRRRLVVLRDTDPARLCWVVVRRDGKNGFELTLQVHRFRSRLEWTDEFKLGVDERVIERVERMADRRLTSERACHWLAEHVLLPSITAEGTARAVATGSPQARGPFRLLGARVAVDVTPQDESLRVERVVTLRGGSRGFRPPEFLIEANIEFVDATLAGQMRQSVRAQIERLMKEADRYIPLWEKYQAIERENWVRRARQLGALSYSAFEALPSGLWRFEVSDPDALHRFRGQLKAVGDEDIEADSDIPPELSDSRAVSEDEGNTYKRAAVGSLEAIRVDRRTVTLRPLDEDSDVLPPSKGVLFGALQGDRRRLTRREQAVRRIKSADARLPQLALILEGENPFVRRIDRVRSFTPDVQKVFGTDHKPTPEQRQAIDIAVNAPDMVVIQGPPGSGKTKVITAIQARLAKLEAESPEIAGRTLLTSYQHYAVDHAASKSMVFGLPAVRFGGKRGDRSASKEQSERWAVQACEQLDAVLAQLPEERPLATYRSVRDRVASYAAGRMAPEELRLLLDELIELPAGSLPGELWQELRQVRRDPAEEVPLDATLDRDLMRRSVRGLRTTEEAFSDDGPRKARQALTRLESILSASEKDLLAQAAAASLGASFDRIDELAALQSVLADQLTPEGIPGQRKSVVPAVLDALNGAVSVLHDRMRESVGGVADAVQEYGDALRQNPAGVRRLLEHYSAVYAATCQQAVAHHIIAAKGGEQTDLEFENVIVDEAARANPLDLFIPMSLAKRRVILVGDHRQLPHLLDPDVEEALEETVREQEQHALKESLFQRLFERLPQLHKNDQIVRVVTLRDQFRMHPVLGAFVSDVFYKPHREEFRSPRPASDFVHNIDGYLTSGRPVCAAWKNISQTEGPERPGRSKSRPSEARWIAGEVHRLLLDVRAEVSIGVITFYRAQVDEILECLVQQGIAERDPDTGIIDIGADWRTLERPDGTREERLRVGTVDAFQGKEFDVVFLSVARSNALPAVTEIDRRRKYGHLMLENRLCVAMSRQRRLLITVGDRAMFETTAGQSAVPGLSRFLALCGGGDGLVS